MQNIRKALCWIFAITSLEYLLISLRSILYATHRPYAFPLFRSLLIAVSFPVVVATVSGVAWWIIWKGKPSARGWGIAASLMNILIFLQPIIFSSRSPWYYHVGALLIGIGGVVAFSRRSEADYPG